MVKNLKVLDETIFIDRTTTVCAHVDMDLYLPGRCLVQLPVGFEPPVGICDFFRRYLTVR